MYLETLKETVQECGAALEELAIIRSDDKVSITTILKPMVTKPMLLTIRENYSK
jgi:hypothetical protein